MHHCPKCYYEYEHRVSVCPDCDLPLVDGPVPTKNPAVRSSDDDSDALLLFESQDFLKLRFLLDLLDQEGIPYATRKMTQYGGAAASEILTVGLSAASTVGGIARVYVAAENYEQAKELLAELEGIALTGDEDIDLEDKS
ncbi:MAG: DUF2007 domain-containing protein [candidate division Zixibacteria bacterium]|jgi:hypothetical protein|nr:DUF2007 domain-containing protein [candidate division Zixibacteria bacterium]